MTVTDNTSPEPVNNPEWELSGQNMKAEEQQEKQPGEKIEEEEEPTANNEGTSGEGTEDSTGPTVIEHSSVLAALLTELKPIDFKQVAKLPEEAYASQRHYVILTIEQILEIAKQNYWALCVSDSTVYVYNGAYWKPLQKSELQQFLGEAAEKLGMPLFDSRYHAFRGDLMKQFVSHAYLPKPQRKGGQVLVNLENGTFVISPEQQYLRPFDRSDFLTYQLTFSYAPGAEAPLFRAYLNRVLPDEKQQRVLSEYIGYVFIRQHTLKLEKSLILYGGGANGKSVFFEVITAMLGAENVSHYSLQSLTNESGYQRAKLKDKLLNYASEISPHMDSTIFKQLVSQEPVECRLPYNEPFILEDYGKLIFNSNSLPKDVEQNEAFFRRFIILHFGVTIPEEERDPELANKIIKSEMAGVFNWVLEGLHRLLQQRKFTYSEAAEKTVDDYRRQSDSVQLFLEDKGYIKDLEKKTALKVMYHEYKNFCVESGYKACSLKVFAERLRNLRFDLDRKNSGVFVDAVKKEFNDASPASPATPKSPF